MSTRKWHKGAPPHVGWWHCKDPLPDRGERCWRWWNESVWSMRAWEDMKPYAACHQARDETYFNLNQIRWCDYYPVNARVPRINPNTIKRTTK